LAFRVQENLRPYVGRSRTHAFNLAFSKFASLVCVVVVAAVAAVVVIAVVVVRKGGCMYV
jgi:hypothetical protein